MLHGWFDISLHSSEKGQAGISPELTAALVGIAIGDAVLGVCGGANRDSDYGAVQGLRVLRLLGVVQLIPAVSHGPEQLVDSVRLEYFVAGDILRWISVPRLGKMISQPTRGYIMSRISTCYCRLLYTTSGEASIATAEREQGVRHTL